MNNNQNVSISYYKMYSEALGKEMAFSVCQPDAYEGQPLNTLFFLHGRAGNETFLEQLNIDAVLSELIASEGISPIRIICPCLDNSRGINSADEYQVVKGKYADVHKGRYEDYLIDELIPHVNNDFPIEKHFIGGVSAGGYTALSLGLRHTDIFSKIGGHMPAVDLNYADEDECYFSDEAMWNSYDPIQLAKNTEIENIGFYLDDGLQDEGGFFHACQKLNKILMEKGLDVELHLSDGHHSAEYVMEHLKEYLRFYAK